MLQQSVTYEPRLGYPLYVTAKRYWIPPFELHADDPRALTLIFLHSTSFHKETWEPSIERVFELAARSSEVVKIREGEELLASFFTAASAEMNEDALRRPEFLHNFTCEKYAQAAHHFLSAGPDHGARVDFRSRNLVGIGHSLGGVSISIVQNLEPLFKFSSIILVEPLLSPSGAEHLVSLRKRLVRSAYKRHDVWESRDEARKMLQATNTRKSRWHPRVLDLFVEHALRQHPGSKFKEAPYYGFTLACTRDQEAAMYRDADGPTKPVRDLNKACSRMPVHIIFGDINDYLSREVQEAIIDHQSGRRFASISRIPGTGHLIPQQVPDELGERIFGALAQNAASSSAKPKL